MPNQEQDMPNRTSNTEHTEGGRKSEWGEGTSEGAGKSIRPMGEEMGSQESVPAGGGTTPGTFEG